MSAIVKVTGVDHPVSPCCWLRSHALRRVQLDPDREGDATPAGRDLLELVHTYAHRAIRQLSVFAGVDRESLGEYLVPSHGVFFIYAATRGDFVLGGVQAVFENDLHHFLTAFMGAETRCALDPACRRHGGACHACLHLGEPVCDRFNHYLDRAALFGHDGYLAAHEYAGPD